MECPGQLPATYVETPTPVLLVISRKTQDKELPLGPTPDSQGVGVVVEGVCLLIALIGRRGTGLVVVLKEVAVALEHEFGPPAMQCESQASPGWLEEDGLAHPVADVEGLEMPTGELRGTF